MLKNILFSMCICFGSSWLWAASLTVQEQNSLIGKGVNISGLEAPNEGDWGPKLTEKMFAQVKAKGFQSVRLPIKWSNHSIEIAPYTIDAPFFARIDTIYKWARQNNLTLIINVHHFDSIFIDPKTQEERLTSYWQQIADHFALAPDSLIFEILNEPNSELTPELWNQIYPKALAQIRKNNPTRAVLIGTANWGGINGLAELKLPAADSHLIATVHYYSPMEFTHQGADWTSNGYPVGVRWTATNAQKMAIAQDFAKVSAWSKANQIPVHLGEFGAYGNDGKAAKTSDRALWMENVALNASMNGLSWNYWELCSGFGILNPDTYVWNDSLVAALKSQNTQAIQYIEPTGNNLIKNGLFDDYNTDWIYGVWNDTAKGTLDINNQFIAQIDTIASIPWSIELLQTGLSIVQGHAYLLKFWLEGDGVLDVGLSGDESTGWKGYASAGTFSATASGQTMSQVLNVSQSDANARLVFNLGYKVGQIKLDSIQLLDLGPTSPNLKSTLPTSIISNQPNLNIHWVYPNGKLYSIQTVTEEMRSLSNEELAKLKPERGLFGLVYSGEKIVRFLK